MEKKEHSSDSEITTNTKIVITVICAILVILFSIYLFNCDEIIIESRMSDNSAGYTVEDVFRRVDYIYLAQFGIIVLLAAIVWMWRLKFGITGFAGIQGESPKIDSYSNDQKATDETKQATIITYTPPRQKQKPSRNVSPVAIQMQNLLNRYSALSTHKIAEILGVSTKTVSNMVTHYPKMFRKNGFGPNTVITQTLSKVNIVLDDFVRINISDTIVEDIRPARIDSFIVDAVVKTRKDVYLFDIKEDFDETSVSNMILLLRHIAEKFNNLTPHIIVIILNDAIDQESFSQARDRLLSQFSGFRADIEILKKTEIESSTDI